MELFRLAEQGSFGSAAEVLAAVDLVIQWKPPLSTTTAFRRFAAWRNFTIGGVEKEKLISQEVGSPAENVIRSSAFVTQDTAEEVETIIMSPSGFGYKTLPTLRDFLDPIRLARWSEAYADHIPKGYVIGLLPSEAGPHIRAQYRDQPKKDRLFVAMNPISDRDSFPCIFVVKCNDVGAMWLFTEFMCPGDVVGLGYQFVFRLLRKVYGVTWMPGYLPVSGFVPSP